MIGLSVKTPTGEASLLLSDDSSHSPTSRMIGTNGKDATVDRPNHSYMQAKDVKHFAFRTTMQLRQIAQDIGINPVEVLLWMSAGVAPKFCVRPDPETGRLRLQPLIDETTGYQAFETLETTAQLIAAKEGAKYLYPQLKAVDIGTEIRKGTGADEEVTKAFATFAGLARAVLGTNTDALVLPVEDPDSGE
jgi:hypothetical protein